MKPYSEYLKSFGLPEKEYNNVLNNNLITNKEKFYSYVSKLINYNVYVMDLDGVKTANIGNMTFTVAYRHREEKNTTIDIEEELYKNLHEIVEAYQIKLFNSFIPPSKK